MKKLDGVETVEVSLEKSSADIKLKVDNAITLTQMRRIIRSNGYPTKDAQITARGKIVERDGKPVLDLLNGSFLELAERPKDAPSEIVEITGVSRADDKNSELLTVGSIKPAERPQAAPPDPLQPLAFLIGRWQGTSEGQPGAGVVTREYTRVLNSRFIRAENRSVYKPQEKNPKGEVHEDLGFFSFDKTRKRTVFRQFHVEGFVSQYVHDTAEAAKLVFVSEAIENIPSGWRARETYIVHGPDEFEEVFEMAAAGKEFEPYSRTRLKRVR